MSGVVRSWMLEARPFPRNRHHPYHSLPATSFPLQSPGKCLPGDPFVAFDVALGRFGDDFVGQLGRGRGLVPAGGLQVVADVLLVEALLVLSSLVLVGRPVATGVGREQLINQDELALD